MSIKRIFVIRKVMVRATLSAIVGLSSYMFWINASAADDTGETVTPIFTRKLDNVPSKKITAIIVDYIPGGKSLAHHHDESASIFAYVLSGMVRSKVNDEEVAVYKAGEFFFEPPGAYHSISENNSNEEPAQLLAVIVADNGATITTYE